MIRLEKGKKESIERSFSGMVLSGVWLILKDLILFNYLTVSN